VKQPIIFTWAIPKFKRITIISYKELPDFHRDGSHLDLIRMNRQVKKIFSCMDRVGYDNDLFDIR